MKFGMAVSTVLIGSAAFVQYSAASVATFKNFPETSAIKAPFVDPASLITFSNPQNSAGYFGIDFGAATTNVPDLPGNILTGNGVALGNQFGLGQSFGFDAALPSAASNVSIDLIYLNVNSSAGTITLTSFDSTGKQVSTSTVTPARTSGAGYLQTTLAVPTSGKAISTFSVRSSNLATGFDNIAVTAAPTPEPSAVGFAAIASLGLLLRRRRARPFLKID